MSKFNAFHAFEEHQQLTNENVSMSVVPNVVKFLDMTKSGRRRNTKSTLQ